MQIWLFGFWSLKKLKYNTAIFLFFKKKSPLGPILVNLAGLIPIVFLDLFNLNNIKFMVLRVVTPIY